MKPTFTRIAFTTLLTLSAAVPAWPEDGRLTLTFAGDIMSHDVNARTSDYNKIYEDVRDLLQNDDLSFGNLEFPVLEDRAYSGYPQFNVRLDYVRAALRGGFDVFSLANNHTRDQGEEAVLKTLGSLILLREERQGGMYYSGVRGDVSRPFAPVVIRKNGFIIGFVAATEFLNIAQQAPYVNIVEYRDPAQAARFLAWIREVAPRYDLLIVSFHGDVEFHLTPDAKKQAFFRDAARAGAHIVWGHHPHVVQPYEWVETEGGRRLVMHSLGNFVSGMGIYYHDRPERIMTYTADSFLLTVRAARGKAGPELALDPPVLITSYTEPNGDVVVKRLEPLAAGPLPAKWKEYYGARLKIFNKFIADMPAYLVPEPPAVKPR